MTTSAGAHFNQLMASMPEPVANAGVVRDQLQQLVRDHVRQHNLSYEQIALATGYEVWSIEGCFSQAHWDWEIGLMLANALGLRLQVTVAP